MSELLHLKSGVSWLGGDVVLASRHLMAHAALGQYQCIAVASDESYAANCVSVNGCVLIPAGHPRTEALVQRAGFATQAMDMTEFQKMDGGLSCLSLRFSDA